MESNNVDLFKASNTENSFAIRLEGDQFQAWRAERGLGQDYQKVWSVEIQSKEALDKRSIDWEAVLDRIIEAYTLSDPVISSFKWPLHQPA
jgi:hypothetical protein